MRDRVGITSRALRAVSVALAAGVLVPAVAAADSPLPSAELVTVTDRGFTATWTTAAATDTTVCVGESPLAVRCERQEASTRFHYAQVDGLRPGRRYSYQLGSEGQVQLPSTTNPGTFRTLVPPPGRYLFDFAVLSDIHLGEGCSGTAATLPAPIGSVPPCFGSGPGQEPYPTQMSRAAVAEVNSRGIGLTLLNADNTSRAKYGQALEARQTLDGLRGSYRIARGAHDRAGQNPPDARCGPDNDCFRSVFYPKRSPGRIFYSFDYRGYHFVVLDSVGSDGAGDLTDPAQQAFLERDLEQARRRGRKTFVYFHHPVAEYATTTSFPPVVFGVRSDRGGSTFLKLMRRFPNVVGVLNAHTHRNLVAYSPQTGARLPYIETGPTKEYPAGYTVIRVYEGGYMRSFQRLRCNFCREWTSTTRGQYFGLYPLYTLGTLSARSFSHVYGCGVETPPSSLLGNESLIDGDALRGFCDRAASAPGGDSGGGPGGGRPPPDPPGGGPGTSGKGRRLTGTAGNDTLVGTPGDDVIICGAGDDRVIAGGGDDFIACGRGNDTIDAGAGNDRVRAGSGNDVVVGAGGRDRIRGGSGRDVLTGGRGRDRVRGERGNDRIAGGAGRDRLAGGRGDDRISGNAGRDWLFGGPGRDVLIGGPGNDSLFGNGGRDRLSGGRGRDRLRGGPGMDRVRR